MPVHGIIVYIQLSEVLMAFWIYADERPQDTHFYYFKKSFAAKAGEILEFSACADTRYQLFVNGALICEGPCQGAAHLRYYEKATAALAEGENEVVAKVQFVGSNYFHIVYRGKNPAFWFDGTITGGDEVRALPSDESWVCLRDDSVKFNHFLGIHASMPPFEEWLSEEKFTPVAIKQWFAPLLATHGYTEWGTIQPASLYERPIPQMKEFARRTPTPIKSGEGYVIYDTGEYTTAKVYLDFNAPKDTEIKITYAECVTFNNPIGARGQGKAVRDDINAEGSRIDGTCDIIRARGGEQSFVSFWYRAFRFIKVEFPKDVDCTIPAPEYGSYFYPFDEAGSFECSNERYNQMWHISRNTLLCCTHETYVDCPYYEQGQYSMDGGLEMLYTFRTTSDRLMPLKFLKDLAESQLPDGMIGAHYPSTITQVIPNFTLFWVLAVRDYLLYTGDKAGISSLMGAVDKALEGFENLKTDGGLIGPTQYWPFVDWVTGWRRGNAPGSETEPCTVTCLMYAASLRAAAEIYASFGRKLRAEEYEMRACEIIEAVNKYCYDEETGLYFDSPNCHSYAQHTTVWAILSGAVIGKEAGKLVDRTFNSDKEVAECTFSMNYYLFRALEAADRYNYASKVFEGWETMLDLHCTTWCEKPGDVRSECHAWSSAPSHELSAMALGVYPSSQGYKTLRIKPMVKDFDMDWARGSVPTPYGSVDVAWENKNGCLTLEVGLPDGDICAEIVLPDGNSVQTVSKKAKFECKI